NVIVDRREYKALGFPADTGWADFIFDDERTDEADRRWVRQEARDQPFAYAAQQLGYVGNGIDGHGLTPHAAEPVAARRPDHPEPRSRADEPIPSGRPDEPKPRSPTDLWGA